MIAVALLLSWIVAVLFAPVIAVHVLPATLKHKEEKKGRMTRFMDRGLRLAMGHRWATILLTVALFGGSLFLMQFVQQQFFPPPTAPSCWWT